jgi:hypothetical protein
LLTLMHLIEAQIFRQRFEEGIPRT